MKVIALLLALTFVGCGDEPETESLPTREEAETDAFYANEAGHSDGLENCHICSNFSECLRYHIWVPVETESEGWDITTQEVPKSDRDQYCTDWRWDPK